MEKKTDYLVAVKDNRPTLAQAVKSLFDASDEGVRQGRLEQDVGIDKGHGRIETRRCVVAHGLSAMGSQAWAGLRSVVDVMVMVMVESTREAINGKKKGASNCRF